MSGRGALSLSKRGPNTTGWVGKHECRRAWEACQRLLGRPYKLLLGYVTGSSETRVEVSGRSLRLVCENAQGGSLRGTWEGH